MTLPNFLLIGAAKSGTTSLHRYLSQHPDIFMAAMKEPAFFAYEGDDPHILRPPRRDPVVTTIEDYEALFDSVQGEIAIGEASPQYLGHPRAPGRIRHYIPNAKLIAVLRHPVDAAYSDYIMRLRDGIKTARSFVEAIHRELESHTSSRDLSHFYLLPRYHWFLARYYALFPQENLKILLYDDLREAPQTFMRELFRFLNVRDDVQINPSLRLNQGGVHRSRLIAALLNRPNPIRYAARRWLPDTWRVRMRNRIASLSLTPPEPLDPHLRNDLTKRLRDDILQLQDLTGLDLSHWLNGTSTAPPSQERSKVSHL